MAPFYLQRFVIQQEQCAMKVGTDAMLLGAWAPASDGPILDIGTGTGILALMLAQRSPAARIEALEIDDLALQQARENIARSPWPEQIQVHGTRLQDWRPQHACGTARRYALILCNPPYFDEAIKPSDRRRQQARHKLTLTHLELLQHTRPLLSEQGLFCLILPSRLVAAFAEQAQKLGFQLQQRVWVSHLPGQPSHRCLMAWSTESLPERSGDQSMSLRNAEGTDFSEAYRRLTASYLKKPPAGFKRQKSRASATDSDRADPAHAYSID